MFVFPLLAYALTGSALLAAAVRGRCTCSAWPAPCCPAGVLADRVDRRPAHADGQRRRRCCSTPRWPSPASPGRLTVPHLLVVALLTGVGGRRVRARPRSSAVRAVVADRGPATALSQNQARQHVAGLVGGPLGGVLYAVTRWLPFAADAVTLRGLLAAARPDPHRPLPRAARRRRGAAPAQDIAEGIRFIVGAAVLPGAAGLGGAGQPDRQRAVLRRRCCG